MTPAPFTDRLRYRFDNFMSKGGLSIFLALLSLFAVAFLLMGALRIGLGLVVPDETAAAIGDELWRTFLQVTDAGAVAEDGEAGWLQKVVGIASIGVGLVLFSSLVAFITAEFDSRLAELRKGKSAVIERDHTLILGTGERAVEIIRELVEANADQARAVVVVLADVPKDELDDFYAERVPERGTTALITRSGSVSSLASLTRMGVAQARAVVILSDGGAADSPETWQLADARVLKSIMGVLAATRDTETPPIIAELHLPTSRRLAEHLLPGRISTLDERSLLAKLMVQTSRTSGLALVYSNLVGFVGNELYFFRPPAGWGGRSFRELQFHFPVAVPLGFREASGRIVLNPPAGYVPDDQADAIVLAEDDSKIDFRASPVASSTVDSVPDRRVTVGPERQLLVGWGARGALIVAEYAQYLGAGSRIDVLVEATDDDLEGAIAELREAFPLVGMHVIEGEAGNPDTVRALGPEQYNNVMLLATGDGGAEEMDARTISLLLCFRQYFSELAASRGAPVDTQLISEVMDSENTELVLQSGVKDFLISNQLVSKVYAQVSQEPAVMKVYDDLFSAEGSEIYLKPASLYFETLPVEVSMADLMTAAQLRGEVCFGVKIAAEELLSAKHYGVKIIPARSERFRLVEGDTIVVLAADEG